MQNESKMQKCPKMLTGLVSTRFYMYTDRPLASIAISQSNIFFLLTLPGADTVNES